MTRSAGNADTTLRIVRTFLAPRERVFRAFVDASELRVWFCPDGFTLTDVVVDDATGCATGFVMVHVDSGARFAYTLEWETVDAPNLIRLTSVWGEGFPEPGRRTHTTVTFRDVPGGTELTLVQSNFIDSRNRDDHRNGWTGGLNKLERFLAR